MWNTYVSLHLIGIHWINRKQKKTCLYVLNIMLFSSAKYNIIIFIVYLLLIMLNFFVNSRYAICFIKDLIMLCLFHVEIITNNIHDDHVWIVKDLKCRYLTGFWYTVYFIQWVYTGRLWFYSTIFNRGFLDNFKWNTNIFYLIWGIIQFVLIVFNTSKYLFSAF